MGQPMNELVVYPACLDCSWRELATEEAYCRSYTRTVTMCEKLPVCKLVEGQEQIRPEVGQ